MTTTTRLTVAEELRKLADSLDPDATWDDALAKVRLWRQVSRGLQDIAEGRFYTQEEIEQEFGLANCE